MRDNLPQHIAIIPDGTRRWARKRGLPDSEGARAGAETAHRTVAYLVNTGLQFLTMWGFSNDNWKRSEEHVDLLFEQVQAWIESDVSWLNQQEVRLRHIGNIERLPPSLQQAISYCVELTRKNTGMTLTVALDYGGRVEIIRAIRDMIKANLSPYMVNEDLVSDYLYTEGMPDVDLVVRTGGELRLSNFMIWQTAYSEYYFTSLLWPDFDEIGLEKALEAYKQRDRRFGGD